MSIRRADISGLAVLELTEVYRAAWQIWARRHAVDTAEWLLSPGGIIEADDEARTVRFLTWHRLQALELPGQQTAAGMHECAACPEPQHAIIRPGNADVCVRWITIQLEAPAMAFPPVPAPWSPPTGGRRGAYILSHQEAADHV